MNSLGFIIAANISATFVVFCGIKLFDMRSELAEIIRRYSAFLGLIIAFVAIFNYLLPDALDLFDDKLAPLVILSSAATILILDYCLNVARRLLLEKKSKKTKRISNTSIATITVLDCLASIVAGAAIGFSFTLNFGTGMMVLCAWILYQLTSKVFQIQQYQDANFSRRANIINFSLSLCMTPIAASLICAWARNQFAHAGFFMTAAVGFFAYLCIYQAVIIVKKFQKR